MDIFSGYLAAGLIAACLCSGVTPGLAHQGSEKPRPVTTFGYLDVDKDARISKQEARVDWAVNQRFAEVDRNRDGYLDQEEFKRLIRKD